MTTERCCSTCQDATTDRTREPCSTCPEPELPNWVPAPYRELAAVQDGLAKRDAARNVTEARTLASLRAATDAIAADPMDALRAAINRGSEMLDAARRDGLDADVIASYCVPPAQAGVWTVTQPPQPGRGEAIGPKPAEDSANAKTSQGEAAKAVATNHADDPVNRPSHYTRGGIEAIDAIEAAIAGLPPVEAFLTGQVLRYVWRYHHKAKPVQDLDKAAWYLKRLRAAVEGRTP